MIFINVMVIFKLKHYILCLAYRLQLENFCSFPSIGKFGLIMSETLVPVILYFSASRLLTCLSMILCNNF